LHKNEARVFRFISDTKLVAQKNEARVFRFISDTNLDNPPSKNKRTQGA
jgi:hypothetical protein